MLSYTRQELEAFTKPLCTPEQYDRKLRNWEAVEQSFMQRELHCQGLPVHLHVEATANCNLGCPICPRGRGLIQREGHLPFADFERASEPLFDTLANVAVSGWGEPLLNPDATRMVSLAISQGVSVFMNTNGTVLAENVQQILDSGLTTICISLDGAESRATHLYDEEFPFDVVVKGVERLRSAKDHGGYQHPHIHGKFIITEETADEMEHLGRWAASLGVERVKFKRKIRTMPGQVPRSQFLSVDQLLKITREKPVQSDEELSFTARGCNHPWDSLFLSGTGHFGLCSWDPHQRIDLGRPRDDFSEIWNGEQMKQVRRWHSGSASEVGEPCLGCNRLPGYLAPQTSSQQQSCAPDSPS